MDVLTSNASQSLNSAYNFAYLDEQTKRMIRRALLKAVAVLKPLGFLKPRETETRKMHTLQEYGLMHVKLYQDIAAHGHIATAYAYPVEVKNRYVMDPSPVPKFDNPKLEMAALQLFGAGREQRIYATPPYTQIVSLDFDDHPFDPSKALHACALCGADDSYLDEVIVDDHSGRMYVCSDTDHCLTRRRAGYAGNNGVTAGVYNGNKQGDEVK